MRDGFIKVAAVTPQIRVADVAYNTGEVIRLLQEAAAGGAEIIVFPELVLTAYTCNDLFLQSTLLQEAREGLRQVIRASRGIHALVFVGLPLEVEGSLYNVAAVLSDGALLGFVPKRAIPNYSEYYEQRYFTPGPGEPILVSFDQERVKLGAYQIFACRSDEIPGGLRVACEICEDLWLADPPSTRAVLAGANVIVNLSASVEVTGKTAYRRDLVRMTSARLVAAYIYASAGEGESSIAYYLYPEWNEPELAKGFVPDRLPRFTQIKWDFPELTSSAATGDPTKATAEKGRKMTEALVDCVVKEIEELDAAGWEYTTSGIWTDGENPYLKK